MGMDFYIILILSGKLKVASNYDNTGAGTAGVWTIDIDTILDSFSYKMKYNNKFYEMIVCTDTNIYPSFIDFYIDI